MINQLIHSVDAKKLAKTKFALRREQSFRRSLVITIMLAFFVLGLSYTKWFATLATFPILRDWETDFRLQVLVICAAIGIFGLFWLIRYISGRHLLGKIAIQGNSIEIFEDSHDSPFDKHLDELLYIIEKSNADVFVFEDIDRFRKTEIFTRLREINRLVNLRISNQKRDNFFWRYLKHSLPRLNVKLKPRVVRFFYGVRDNLFTSKDRTKFFDFIIPIVPIVVMTNSYERFSGLLKESELLQDFDGFFLGEISRYIDDMRVMKNIVNEYIIYAKRINNPNLDPNKFLAMLTFKNIHPDEFADLQNGKGSVFNLFHVKKYEFVKTKSENIQDEIEKLILQKGEVQSALSEVALTGEKISSDDQYEVKLLTNKRNDLTSEIDRLKRKQRQISTDKLANLLDGDEQMFSDLNKQPLTTYLVRFGYLDENYADYMSYILGSLGDHAFLRSVTDRKPKEFTYALDFPKEVMKNLRTEHFEGRETLNNSLLDYILRHQSLYREQLKYLVDHLERNGRMDFISQYLQLGQEPIFFVIVLNRLWPQIWPRIEESTEFTPEQVHNYAITSLLHSHNEVLLRLDFQGELYRYICNNPDFLDIEELTDQEIENITANLKQLNVEFGRLNFTISNPKLVEAIYRNDLYEINQEMIFSILENMYHFSRNEDYVHRNYTLISSDPDQHLFKYIDVEMKRYLRVMLEFCDTKITDSEEAALKLLNHQDCPLEKAKEYLSYLKTSIKRIVDVNNTELWPALLSEQVVEDTEENILDYYFEYSESLDTPFDQNLVEFMNLGANDPTITSAELKKRYGEERRDKWFDALVTCRDLDDTVYEQWLRQIGFQYTTFSIIGLPDSKISILVKHKVIQMNAENFSFMRNNYPQHILEYIYTNIQPFIEEGILNKKTFKHDECLSLLSRNIEDDYKLALLGYASAPISIKEQPYSEQIQHHILRNNFEVEDLPWLVGSFDDLPDLIKNIAVEKCVENLYVLIRQELVIPHNLLILLLKQEIEENKKHQLIGNSLEELGNSPDAARQAANYFQLANLSDLVRALRGYNPTVGITDHTKKILEILKTNEWISRYRVDRRQQNKYRIQGRTLHHPLPKE